MTELSVFCSYNLVVCFWVHLGPLVYNLCTYLLSLHWTAYIVALLLLNFQSYVDVNNLECWIKRFIGYPWWPLFCILAFKLLKKVVKELITSDIGQYLCKISQYPFYSVNVTCNIATLFAICKLITCFVWKSAGLEYSCSFCIQGLIILVFIRLYCLFMQSSGFFL